MLLAMGYGLWAIGYWLKHTGPAQSPEHGFQLLSPERTLSPWV
jgi:hypothetical protein